MKSENWEDIRLFLIVARRGGLTGASQETGMSPPTIGRRMLALERSMGRSLFVRGPTGYSLAVDGQILFERARSMETAAQAIVEWQQDIPTLPIVSIGADTWTLRLIAENLSALWSPSDSFRICLKVFDAGIDFTYRDAQIGVVADKPTKGNAAIRPAGLRKYAPYRSLSASSDAVSNWVSLGTDTAPAPWMRWTFLQAHLPIIAWTNSQTGLLDLVRAGAGTGVLPCMVGDRDMTVKRAGPEIIELEHPIWLVMHDDDRQRPEVRLTIDRLGAFLAF